MVAKNPIDDDKRRKKNRRDLEISCVKMVKKQALKLVPYLELSADEFDLCQRHFALKHAAGAIDEDIGTFYHRIPEAVDSIPYTRLNCLLKSVRTILFDLEQSISMAEEDLDLSLDQNVRGVIQRLANHSYVYSFLSMSFALPEAMRATAQIKERMDALSTSAPEEQKKTIVELEKFIDEQRKYRLELSTDKTRSIDLLAELKKVLESQSDQILSRIGSAVEKVIKETNETCKAEMLQSISAMREPSRAESSRIDGQNIRIEEQERKLDDLKKSIEKGNNCPVCTQAQDFIDMKEKVQPIIVEYYKRHDTPMHGRSPEVK